MIKDVNDEILSFGFVPYFISLVKFILNPDKIGELITHCELTIEENDGHKMLEAFGQQNSVTVTKELRSLYT